MSKQKLELTWIGKDKRPRLEPRILLEDPARSYHAAHRVTERDIFDNRLIFGDNLLALKALEQEFTGKVKCVFIDPPYNTGSAFTHYDDGLEHSIWLGLMRDRLEIIRRLLSDDGSLWITIDDNEAHYLKVLCDEVFGRANFLTTVIWEKKYAPKADSKFLSSSHDFILVCAKNIDRLALNRLPKTEKQTSRYTNRDNDPRGPWKAGDTLRNEVRDYAVFPVMLPSGREVFPSAGTSWRYTKEKFAELIVDNRIWFGVDGDARPAIKRFISEVTETIPATTVWRYDEVGHNDEAKKESKVLFGDGVFGTPKPERLMARILEIATNPNDLVLDSFAGSGTTGAVAHKMGRRWIMIELGEHCHTHIIPRLKKVIDGDDPGGITQAVGWQGGGGFRYYRLAPSLIVNDHWGNPVVNPDYNAAQLAEALCKLEGFSYAPSETRWWQHGHSSERDFIYVTTQNLSAEQLQALSDEVGGEQSLLICCAAFHGVTAARAAERWPNLTLKKIPKMVLARCEWGHDDYSLNVANLPMAASPEPTDASAVPCWGAKVHGGKTADSRQSGLFQEGEV
ncbi:DNA methylase N-4/N-6 domain-containing protein [Acidithiobacillus ferrivorans]|uniref:site-specific DNA-methyltransferase (adenine-specific) n=1 Tax=Acidithiobacillus ferrivorans TaxID=160808 RepID=A0A060UKS1_9PROT|nr:site-specific DNA-methyltransferase [Acidithiobacillus ferrivorans]CDQ09282.1 DNA methylase N-4/N-6 domain protein [Acidithiobacillus ferrivorans]SMH64953.1 DNA methylase N-4/N-6 domain-containing protein [Acidithiobacillus ferrivorans]